MLLQVWLLLSWLSSDGASLLSWLVPLALPLVTSIDLLLSRRSGPLSFRLPLAALTLFAPTFMILELHRLRSEPLRSLRPPVWAHWPTWMGLCSSANTCGASLS